MKFTEKIKNRGFVIRGINITWLLAFCLMFISAGYSSGEYHDAKVNLFAELKKKPAGNKGSRYKKWQGRVSKLCYKLTQDPDLTEKNLEILIAVSPEPFYLERSRQEVLPVILRLAGTVMDRAIAAGKTNYSMKTSALKILNQIRQASGPGEDSTATSILKVDSSYYLKEEEIREHREILLDEIVNANKDIRGLALDGLAMYAENEDVKKALVIVKENDPVPEFKERARALLGEEDKVDQSYEEDE